jgi:hypothetical protein
MRRRFRARGYLVVRCERCDLERVEPMPDEETLAKVYARGYFSGGGHGYEDYFGRERAVADAKAKARMDALERCGLAADANVLELGCADGRFLCEAVARGRRARGVEASREARDAADPAVRGAICEALSALDEREQFDAFAAFDVLEHLPDPLGPLAALRPKMRAGALVAVVVPDIANANARWAPWSWDQYKPPEHLWFFSTQSVSTLIERGLDATVIERAPAWERDARVCDAVFGRRGALSRLEGRGWRALVARGWMDPARLVDSTLVIARVRA